jgi:uncharacterized protein
MTNGRTHRTNARNSKSPAGDAPSRNQPARTRGRDENGKRKALGKGPRKRTTPPPAHKRTAPAAAPAPARREVRLPLYSEALGGHGKPDQHAKPKAATCTSCGLCCSYVAIEIDTPKTVKQATMMLWYVYHEGISLYVNDDDWMVQFDTTCIHLQPDYRCGVYETRPHICREFSEQDCEVNTGDDGRTFYTAGEFLEYLAQTRPRVHAVVKKSFSPPDEAPRTRLTPFEHRFQAAMSRRSALGI